jgi:hypothetical protein
MFSVELYGRVRHACHVEGLSADSDDVGRLFRSDVGHRFQNHVGRPFRMMSAGVALVRGQVVVSIG